MGEHAGGIVVSTEGRTAEGFEDRSRGDAHWFTLFSGERTPTRGMSAGVMVLPPGARLEPHRHAQAEIYFVAAGEGVLALDGVESRVLAGMAAFIQGDALHGLRNEGGEALRVFYVFPTDRFDEVVYWF